MRPDVVKAAALTVALVALPAGAARSGAGAGPGANPVLLGQQAAGSPIGHVIVLVQENRSFDNLFASSVLAHGGPYPGADTSQTATVDGKRLPLAAVSFEYPADPRHDHVSLLAEWDRGKMDGFGRDRIRTVFGFPPPSANFPYAYLPASDTAIYHTLAARYALADRNFATRLIPTFASHFALVTAQPRVAGNPNSAIWGCDAKAGATVPLFGPGEAMVLPGVFPCFDDTTIGDLLNTAGVSWKYYTGAYDSARDPTVNVYDAFRSIRYGTAWQRNVVTPSGTVLSDIANCRLPRVSFVMPNWLDSDHAGSGSAGGPGWVGSIYLAVARSRRSAGACNYYKDTALILTWDDSGGWYDHVPPPPGPDGTTWGMRIPIVVMSAWARSGYDPRNARSSPYVSHTRRESTSIVKFIEENWNLGNMGRRDVTDDDLHDLFDYTRAVPVPPLPEAALQRMIRATHFRLALAESNDHAVDDDR